MSLLERVRGVTPLKAVEVFIVANVAFLAVDIFIAHTANEFARADEWIPIVFSAIATLLLLPGLFRRQQTDNTNMLAIAIGAASIVIGLAGMFLHLESAFFRAQTLKNLVYTAPFAAPLSYVGLGLLILLDRLEKPHTKAWAAWVLFLAMGGFVGNFALSLADHAQNGFFRKAEWLSVIAAAFGTSFLAVDVLWPSRPMLRATLVVMALEVVVGVAGALLHLTADFGRPGARLEERLVFGAPVFAPLLFADLALLAAIGVWAMLPHCPPIAEARRADATTA